MAVALSDAVIRRTPLGALGHPGDGAAAAAADIMGNELGWSEERKAKERGELSAFYRIG
jgi:glycerol-3-phosphate dehydrogenase